MTEEAKELHQIISATVRDMTSAARARSEGGIVSPRALAGLRFITTWQAVSYCLSSNLSATAPRRGSACSPQFHCRPDQR